MKGWIYGLIIIVVVVVLIAGYLYVYAPQPGNVMTNTSNQSPTSGNTAKSGVSYQILPILKTGPP